MEYRLIIEQFDPERPVPGGVDTCIRGLVQYCPPGVVLRIAGVDALGNKPLGVWESYRIGARKVEFMPLARVDYANLERRIPHSALVARGLRRYRPAPESDVVQTHRINTGAVAINLYPNADHVQLIHRGNDLKMANESFFRYATFLYRLLERYVIPRTRDTVVFSREGADRLSKISSRVRFSPTWFDPQQFYPVPIESNPRRRIIWACRIEPGKNPELAIDIMAKLPADYTLTVAGSGTLEPAMRDRAHRAGVSGRVTFLGAVPKNQMGDVLRDHDIMLMTSSSEGFSRSIVEALASGLPVVTTPGGEPNGLVKSGVNGVRVESYSPDDFVPALEIGSKLRATAAVKSVAGLTADSIVSEILSIPPLGPGSN